MGGMQPRAAAHGSGVAPFLGERLENFGRFVANDILPFRNRADESAKYRQAAQPQIGAAIVNADLRMTLQQRLGIVVIANADFPIRAAGYHAKGIFVHGLARNSERGWFSGIHSWISADLTLDAKAIYSLRYIAVSRKNRQIAHRSKGR